MSQRIVLTSLSLFCAAACGGAPAEGVDTRTTEQPIVNGTPSVAADDAVVMLTMDEGLCTGTLVAPNLVVTARHCVAEIDESSLCGTFGDDMEPSSISVVLGVHADFDDPDSAVAHGAQLFHESGTDGCATDIAFILLDKVIPDAKVAAVRTTLATVGEAVRTIGYGESGLSGHQLTDGRYERKDLTVDSVGPDSYDYVTQGNKTFHVDVAAGQVLTGESTCFGDSGGPLFDAAGAVIGVTSSGIDDKCIDRPSLYTATATHVALVQQAFEAAGVDATPDAGAPDSGTVSSSSSSSSSSGSGDDDSADDDATSSSSGSTTHDTSTSDDSGCSTGTRAGFGSSGLLWGIAGLIASRRRRALR